ncbi:hypothetical protein P7K49_015203 [Saguinus oedipus]|uniref:Peptidase M13 N-terminal domain-containing protein n=1 Tax=Saguinus oedipus TaxID=9490 RepID=A0ABQ9V8J8_SAGOE|nr:hypothetical protein P7K49_015203 [Saguinus oedipus]
MDKWNETTAGVVPHVAGSPEDQGCAQPPPITWAHLSLLGAVGESVPHIPQLPRPTGPPVSSLGTASPGLKWELERQLALMNSQFNRRVLIDLFVWNDDQNSSRHVIYIDQPTLGMPSRDYYFSGGRDRKVGRASLQHRTPVAPTPRAGLPIAHPASLPTAGVVSNCAVSPALRSGGQT